VVCAAAITPRVTSQFFECAPRRKRGRIGYATSSNRLRGRGRYDGAARVTMVPTHVQTQAIGPLPLNQSVYRIIDEMRRPVSKRDAFVMKLPSALEVQ
jgi:hypothetical protein